MLVFFLAKVLARFYYYNKESNSQATRLVATKSKHKMGYDYDYLVFGGGSGGVSSAKRAAINHGKKVAVIEGKSWGG